MGGGGNGGDRHAVEVYRSIGMARRLSAFEGSKGWIARRFIDKLEGYFPGAEVVLSLRGVLSQLPDRVVFCHPDLFC